MTKVSIQHKARQIKAKLAGDGSIRIFEEQNPGCLAMIADKMRQITLYGVAFGAGVLVGLLIGG